MTHDQYEGFAERYDLAVDRIDEHDPVAVAFFRRLFAESGYHAVDFYGAFGFDPYDKETSNKLIAVAHY